MIISSLSSQSANWTTALIHYCLRLVRVEMVIEVTVCPHSHQVVLPGGSIYNTSLKSFITLSNATAYINNWAEAVHCS